MKKPFKIPGERQFEIVINATDRGVPSVPTITSIKIQVLSDGHPPYFDPTTGTTEFKEHHAPAYFERTPARISHKYSSGCDEIIYSIIEGDDEGFFFIDKNVLRLHKPLDYESKPDDPKYVLKIAATNPDGKQGDSSILELTVKIVDENDCSPEFVKKSYAAGISVGDKPGKIILQFLAIDQDKGDRVTYALLEDTMTADDSLKSHMKDIKMTAAGELVLNFFPDNTMHGYFSFQIVANDNASHSDTADVRVYVIADSNRHNFLFDNHKTFIDDNKLKIEEIFTKYIGYNCNVEEIMMEGYSYTQELNQTSVIAFFIDANESLPVENGVTELQGSGDSELVGVEDNPEFSPQNHRMESRRGSKNPIFDDIENEKEWSSVEYSPDINMNEEKNPNFSFGPPTTNVPTTELLINEKAKEIKGEFKKYTLYWVNSTPEDKSTDNGEDQSALTQTVLIVVSALLATLVLLLLATFFFKIRSYNRRLEALSQTKFGSQDSGLNRVNMNVPNTNQHALEGSNPVWNEELGNEDNIR
ncbi:hypothetical protein J437_LFUL012103 [Ladona fulva]|uniref:Cadherin domain-containing protein n=1 Tax=Ladona fulva TaxID=123851 RepID=A0A8K0KCI7_LADFU|nr:hypothetical protein J437_LFUL012103 [Ladona fulva]